MKGLGKASPLHQASGRLHKASGIEQEGKGEDRRPGRLPSFTEGLGEASPTFTASPPTFIIKGLRDLVLDKLSKIIKTRVYSGRIEHSLAGSCLVV